MAAATPPNPVYVQSTAVALAFLTSLPLPDAPAEKIKDAAWLSYGLVKDKVPAGSILDGITPPGVNYVGAATFAAYIVVSTYMALRVFVRLAQASAKVAEGSQGSQKLSVFSSMAFLSFTVLSVNMGLFLVESYMGWRKIPAVQLKLVSSSGYLDQLRQWVTTSTLFVDFAKSLYQTKGGYWWASQELGATMISTMYMTAAGQFHGIEKLSDYIILAQLVPVSLAQNLFFVAVLLVRMRAIPSSKPGKPTGVLPEPVSWLSFAAFRTLLVYLPIAITDSNQSMPAIAATRLLLFLNYFVSFQSASIIEEALPMALMYKLMFSLSAKPSLSKLQSLASSISVNFAVNTMGVDFAIWSATVFMWWLSEYIG